MKKLPEKKERVIRKKKPFAIAANIIDVTVLKSFIKNYSDNPVDTGDFGFHFGASAGKNANNDYVIVVDLQLRNLVATNEEDKICAEFRFGFIFSLQNWSEKKLEKVYLTNGSIPSSLQISLMDIVFNTIRGMLVVLLSNTMYKGIFLNVFPKYDPDKKKFK